MASLNCDFYFSKKERPLSDEEKAAARYVYKNAPDEDYNDLIKDDGRYFSKYNFSDYRQSILRWYPFKKDSSALEINAECGALTGALLDNCGSVFVTEPSLFKAQLVCGRYDGRDNLTVFAGDFHAVDFKRKFDYIVFFKTLERSENPVETLNFLKGLLKPGGVLLLEAENQYGIQNLLGKKDSHSGIPFDSFAGYPSADKGRGFSRAALQKILEASAFAEWNFYYPLPDAFAPRAIYSDKAPPKANMIERLVVAREDASTFVADERRLYVDAVENGVYHFLSNSFFVEASDSTKNLASIRSATLGGYRSRKKSFATIIRSDGLVQKKGLFSESAEYANDLCALANELASRGVNVLPMRAEGNSLFMDFVSADTVQMFFRKLVQEKDEKTALEIFDFLWNDILKSSDLSKASSLESFGLDAGPLLKRAYLEMVSINSFWIDGRIFFFDQEVVRNDYPALYVFWRSLAMLYGQIAELDALLPRRDINAKYKITEEMEKLFESLEQKLDKDENPYQVFYQDPLSEEKAAQNRMRLLGGAYGG